MKKFLGVAALLLAFALPGFAQGHRLSPEDQSKFDSYYSRWIEYRQTNNRDQERSMEERMREVMSRNGIPGDVPFERVASNGGYGDRDGIEIMTEMVTMIAVVIAGMVVCQPTRNGILIVITPDGRSIVKRTTAIKCAAWKNVCRI